MRVLFAYLGTPGPLYVLDTTPEQALETLPTTHMSEVNGLLVPWYLQQLGHEVAALTEQAVQPWWMPQVHIDDADPADWDVLYLWKRQSVTQWVESHPRLLALPWRNVAAWFDFGGLSNVAQSDAIGSFAWGTERIARGERPNFPSAHHCVVEHATTFVDPPEMGETKPRGLFAGRLPAPYLRALKTAADHVPMMAYVLSIKSGASKVNFRPGQYSTEDLASARRAVGPNVEIYTGSNMLKVSKEASAASFGLVPSTRPPGVEQAQSASKAWDYWAMGLPVVIDANVPEARMVGLGCSPFLGSAYNSQDWMQAYCSALCEDGAEVARQKIQDWTFRHHTWKHRAQQIHEEQLCTLS